MEFCATNGRLQPGFRFHPTNVELVMYYLKRKVLGKCLKPEIMTELDVYQFHPKDLRHLAPLKKDLNWYFFCPRGKKYQCGERTNRATHSGYWKATGNDRDVSYEGRTVGKIKTLIFHEGKPPKGTRTDWVMHEYRLEDKKLADQGVCQGSYVLSKIFEKSGWGPKNAEQYGAPFVEEEWADDNDDVEMLNCNQPVQAVNQTQSASVLTNSAFNPYAPSTSEQYIPLPVSVSPNANAACNIASSSKGAIPDYDYAVDQVLAPLTAAGNMVSCPDGLLANYNGSMVLASAPVANAVVLPSTSAGLLANYNGPMVQASAPVANTNFDDDEIARMIDRFYESDEIYGSLPDLDRDTGSWGDFACGNFDEAGLYLTDLDPPL